MHVYLNRFDWLLIFKVTVSFKPKGAGVYSISQMGSQILIGFDDLDLIFKVTM